MNEFILTLGSNHEAQTHIPMALETITKRLQIAAHSPLMITDAVDFPYPSPKFTNIVLFGHTSLSLGETQALLHSLEHRAGRTMQAKRQNPAIVHLDADIVVWCGAVLKPRDLNRPYLRDGLKHLGITL